MVLLVMRISKVNIYRVVLAPVSVINMKMLSSLSEKNGKIENLHSEV